MKTAEVKDQLFQALNSRFKETEFKFRKSQFEFVRTCGDIRQIFSVTVTPKTEWFIVATCAFIGSAKMNGMFNEILARDIRTTGPTVGYGVDYLSGNKRGRYGIENSTEIVSVADRIWSDFTEVGVPFFDKVNSVEALYGFMSGSHDRIRPVLSISVACFAVIAAHLSGRQDFGSIADDYFQFFAKNQSPTLAKKILEVRDALIGPTTITKT